LGAGFNWELAADQAGGFLGLLAGKILRDIPRLSQNEAYAHFGLSELLHSDQDAERHGTARQSDRNIKRRYCGGIMVIKAIGRAEFIHRLSLDSDLEHFIGKEVEWFSNKTGNIIGTIALGDSSRGWNYVILKRNQLGKFNACDVVCDFYSHGAARVDFMFAMVGAGRSREKQFPRMVCR
jgi:hypothetical protein